MARRITISNQKGGSGKTTTAVNLAAGLAELGKRVLIFDMDGQGNTTKWLGHEVEPTTMYKLIVEDGEIESCIRESSIENVWLVPSAGLNMGQANRALVGQPGAERILKEKLAGELGKWDYILFDTSPSFDLMTYNALTASECMVIPVITDVMALQGLVDTMLLIERFVSRIDKKFRIAGVLPTMFDVRTRHANEVVDMMRRNVGDKLFKTIIRRNVKLAECPSHHQSIFQYDGKSFGAEDYRNFTKEFLKRLSEGQ